MESKGTLPVYTLEDVAQHTTVDNLWVAIRGKVCNVSGYLDDHPGGKDVMLEVAGTDATEDFKFVGHSQDALKALVKFEIGSLAEYSVCEERAMRKQIFSDEPENERLPFFKAATYRILLLPTKLELWKRLGLVTLGLTLIPVTYVAVLRHYAFQLGNVLDFGGFQSGVIATLILFGALAAAASAWFRRCVFHYKEMSWYMHTYFVGLTAVGYDALWGSLVKNGTARAFGAVKASGTLPDGNLLRKVYSKIQFLDQFLLSPVIFYDALLRYRNPVYRSLLVSLFSTMQTTAFCTITHGFLSGSPVWWNIIESLLWGVFNQSYGAAFVYPLYCLTHLPQLKNEDIEETKMKKLSIEDAEALLYTSIIAAALPAWLIYPAFVSCSSKTRQFLIASYRATPIIFALAQPVIAFLIRRFRRTPLDGSYISPLVKGSLYLSGACSALGHLYALSTSLVSAQVTLTGIFWPWATSVDISSISVIAQGCHLFLQNDWWVIFAAFVPYASAILSSATCRRIPGKNFSTLSYADTQVRKLGKPFGGLIALAVVFSPGAVLAWTMAAKV